MSEREELACPVCRVTMLPDDGDARGMFPAPPHSQCQNCGTIVPKKAADDYLRQPPAPVQVSEDEVKAIVAKAMEEAWSDFCVDANAYPPDITNRRGRISFSPHTWADWTGALVYRALAAALQAGVPSGIVDDEKAGEPLLTEEQLVNLMRDPRYWKKRDPEILAKVTDGFRRLYPDPAPGEGR